VVHSPGGLDSVDFDRALASLRQERFRPEITIVEAPAPQRLAPHAVALTAEILDGSWSCTTPRVWIPGAAPFGW
jgi:hypothetical protein